MIANLLPNEATHSSLDLFEKPALLVTFDGSFCQKLGLVYSPDDFVIISDDAAKHYKVKIIEANLYVRKMTLNDEVVSAIEKTLLTSPAAYPYFETLTKTFLASTGLHSWKQEDIFARETIRRLAICLNTNETFLGNNMQNPFYFQKFDLEQIYIYRNRLPVADSPISTNDNKRLYFINIG